NPTAVNPAYWLARTARADPARTAVYLGDAPWRRYVDLAARAARLAQSLRGRLALCAGDRVALVMRNLPEYLEILYATWWAGLAAVPVNAKLHPHEVRFILEDCGAKVAFLSNDWRSGIGAVVGGMARAPRVIETASAEYEALQQGDAMAPAQ